MDFEHSWALKMKKVRSILPCFPPFSILLGKGWNVYKFLKIHISFSVVEALSRRGEEDRRIRTVMKGTQ